MLDAFIIEQIKRREQKHERLQPRLETPSRFPLQRPPERNPDAERERRDRDDETEEDGLIIIEM